MAYRDRLAASRAQRQQQPVELSNLEQPQNPSYTTSPTNPANSSDTPAFLAEDSAIQQGIQQLRNNVARLAALRLQSVNAIDETHATQEEIDTLTNETRGLSQDLKNRIQQLESQPMRQDVQLRKNRITLLRNKFVEALQEYQREEQEGRQRSRQRVERQLKIVKPDATPQEVAAAVEGGGQQIFAQALSSSTRYGESRSAYREVQERQQELRRVEQTLAELAQLFQDMAAMVERDDQLIDNIHDTVQKVNTDTEAAAQQTEIAVKHARSYRKGRWICFGITFTICAVIALAVGLYFGVGPGSKK
ncbi:t-SNARE [Crepidotus variabilis]|uniref:t-SNARE n=1 Tax=Crepidotus variabilis TaxID=179855 RepID=A0A9P6ENC7_9AGAR|nr:t-SNARE [Crepidotus variabilis]